MQSTRFSVLILKTALGLTLLACFFVTPATATPVQQTSSAEVDARSIGDYRRDLRTFMKLSKDEDAQLERNAVFNLCQLHNEIVTDSRFETNQQLQGFRAVIAKRLETYIKDIKNEKLRAERESKSTKNNGSSKSNREGNGETETEPTASQTVDTDEFVPMLPEEPDASESMYESTADSYYSMGQFTGGPNQLFGYAGGRFAPPWDHGEELVDLIVNTLDPSVWRRNGGTASIQYFRPLRVLVLHAPMQSHGDTTDLLNKLRGAGDVQVNVGGIGAAIGN